MDDYRNVCYLIHFDEPLNHSQHYIGFALDLRSRLAKHRRGEGAAILAECNRRGIGYRVVRVWAAGQDRRFSEKQLKALGARYLCPVCIQRDLHMSKDELLSRLQPDALVSTPR